MYKKKGFLPNSTNKQRNMSHNQLKKKNTHTHFRVHTFYPVVFFFNRSWLTTAYFNNLSTRFKYFTCDPPSFQNLLFKFKEYFLENWYASFSIIACLWANFKSSLSYPPPITVTIALSLWKQASKTFWSRFFKPSSVTLIYS